MDEFKSAMNFNEAELEQWDIARKQKEDDGVQLSKYTKADDALSMVQGALESAAGTEGFQIKDDN